MQRLTIQALQSGQTEHVLRIPGRVGLDELHLARIGAAVSGRVVEIIGHLGQTVHKGDVLARLHSTELGAAQSAYLKALTQVNLKRLASERAERLLQAGAVSKVIAQERQHELEEVEVNLRAAADQLRLMGMRDDSIQRLSHTRAIDSVLPVLASADGTLIERHVSAGQVIQPSDALYTIADLSRVWVVAEAPEQDARWVNAGDAAEAEIPAASDAPLSGRVSYVADLLDPDTRTATVRMELANPQHALKPQMLATLLVRKHAATSLLLPDAAVVREENRDYVFVEQSPGQFSLRLVSLAARSGEQRRVLDGITAGERVVVRGAFHLNNERRRSELE